MKFPLITQRCQLGDGVRVVQVNPLLYPSSRGKKQARPQAPLRTEGQREKSFGTQTNITPFLSLGCQRSQFSEVVTDKHGC